MHFIDAVVLEDADFLAGVEISMDVYLVVGFCNAWPFHKWFYRHDRPVPVLDMVPRLKVLYEEIELCAVKLLVQRLRLGTEEVLLEQSIL